MSMLANATKRVLRFAADTVIASSKSPKIQKYISYPAPQSFYILQNSSRHSPECSRSAMPLPPQYLRLGYGAADELWLNGGKVDIDNMMTVVNSANFGLRKGNRVL